MEEYTIAEVEKRIKNAEIILQRAQENKVGPHLISFLNKDIAYWTDILNLLRQVDLMDDTVPFRSLKTEEGNLTTTS